MYTYIYIYIYISIYMFEFPKDDPISVSNIKLTR